MDRGKTRATMFGYSSALLRRYAIDAHLRFCRRPRRLIAWSIEVMLVGEFAAASSLFSNTETCPHFTLSSNASWPIG
jgi:hypothetical protein